MGPATAYLILDAAPLLQDRPGLAVVGARPLLLGPLVATGGQEEDGGQEERGWSVQDSLLPYSSTSSRSFQVKVKVSVAMAPMGMGTRIWKLPWAPGSSRVTGPASSS